MENAPEFYASCASGDGSKLTAEPTTASEHGPVFITAKTGAGLSDIGMVYLSAADARALARRLDSWAGPEPAATTRKRGAGPWRSTVSDDAQGLRITMSGESAPFDLSRLIFNGSPELIGNHGAPREHTFTAAGPEPVAVERAKAIAEHYDALVNLDPPFSPEDAASSVSDLIAAGVIA